jgi:hypothetical protein
MIRCRPPHAFPSIQLSIRQILYALLIATTLAIVVLLIAFNVVNLREMHSDGPPHYARVANMQQWINPLPVVIAVDMATALIIACSVHLIVRRRRTIP